MQTRGRREYIQVLRLLEHFSLTQVEHAIKQAIAGDMGGAIAAAVGGAGAMFTALKAQDASSEDKSK